MNDTTKREGFSLDRWSRRKHAAKRSEDATPATPAPAEPVATPAIAPVAAAPAAVSPASVAEPPALPTIDSLTPQSDFTAFMRPEVDESLKRAALKKLFADPHFNVMDGLDVYIDDYSKPDPIPPDMLARLLKNRALFDPPRTRVNADGVVEDIPDDESAGMAGAPVAPDALALPPAAGTPPPAAFDDADAPAEATTVERTLPDKPDGSPR